MSADDLYATLGVQRDAHASSIKKAYLKAARQTHPDRNPGDEDAKARFQAIGRAYATLSDPEKKSVYDAAGIVAEASPGAGAAGTINPAPLALAEPRPLLAAIDGTGNPGVAAPSTIGVSTCTKITGIMWA